MDLAIRPYRPADLAAVKGIAADTAHFGEPIETVFPGRDLVADALIGPYARFEADSLFVAESGGCVVGYAAGALDTRRHDRIVRRRILPGLALRFLRGHWRRLCKLRLVTALRVERRRAAVARWVIPLYPAHCHVNVAAGRRGAGVGRALLKRFLDHARASGIAGVHASTATEGGRRLFAAAGFATLARVPAHDPGGPPRAGWIMGTRLTGASRRTMPAE